MYVGQHRAPIKFKFKYQKERYHTEDVNCRRWGGDEVARSMAFVLRCTLMVMVRPHDGGARSLLSGSRIWLVSKEAAGNSERSCDGSIPFSDPQSKATIF